MEYGIAITTQRIKVLFVLYYSCKSTTSSNQTYWSGIVISQTMLKCIADTNKDLTVIRETML